MARGFPAEFTWGVATSAYQIEGGREQRGESIWDTFAHTPGNIVDGTNGDVACDHFNRVHEDVALMRSLGVSAYRFSIAWTRVLPNGTGTVNPDGLAFYDTLVDELLAAGITPWVTLYHWDLPQSLEDAGGWPNRDTVGAFVEYADVVTSHLGDRVKDWITINEPWVAAFLGYRDGIHAPGRRDWGDALGAGHHLLLAHCRAVPVIRANVPDASIGIALDCRPSSPASDRPEDVRAQRHFDGFRNRWFFDPVFGRGYPDDMVRAYRDRGRFPEERPPFDRDNDLDEIAAPIDFLGLNYYTSVDVATGSEEADDPERSPGSDQPEGFTEMGWRNTPGALARYLSFLHQEYRPSRIVVTENGASYSDGPDEKDERRIDYLRTHIDAVGSAIEAGAPVDGYFVWSLLDNFEWGLGYTQRFGLVGVDGDTLERVSKRSFKWYHDWIARHRIPARATANSDHKVPDRPAIQISVGESVSIGRRSSEWPAFVFITSDLGDGWVPTRHLSAEQGPATVETDYDTTELAVAAGETVEVLARDDLSGWWWCRNESGDEGWVPRSVLTRATS